MAVDGVCDELDRQWYALAALRDGAVELVRRRVALPLEAEDYVQEAVVRLSQRSLTSLEPARLRWLLVRVACCLAIDRTRWLERQQRQLSRLVEADLVRCPADVVAERFEARSLAAAMTSLGVLERESLRHRVGGYRVEETARVLGVPYKSVENALGRARRKLRDHSVDLGYRTGREDCRASG